MGIFDRFRKAIQREYEYAPNDEKEAWVGLLYACIIADGEIMKVEENSLSLMLITKKKFEKCRYSQIVPSCCRCAA
jgi:hypothetical protein